MSTLLDEGTKGGTDTAAAIRMAVDDLIEAGQRVIDDTEPAEGDDEPVPDVSPLGHGPIGQPPVRQPMADGWSVGR